MKTVTYNGGTYPCPLSELFVRHTDDERETMRHYTAAVGNRVLVPVRLYHDTTLGKPNCVLDGEGRLEIAAELGLAKVPFVDEGKLTSEEAFERAKVFNDARRQDTPEAVRKRRIERVAEKRAAGKSLQTIADEEGVSKAQIRRDINCAPPGTVEPEEVVGKDGKTRTAKPSRNGTAPHAEDEGHQPAGVLASAGSADECRQAVEQMHRELARFQERLSGLMAGDFAQKVKDTAHAHDFKLWTDGELQGGQAWGSVRYGVAKYTADPLESLFAFMGTLKVVFDRERTRPAAGAERGEDEDPFEAGKELRGDDYEF